jgi:hypothetical protein
MNTSDSPISEQTAPEPQSLPYRWGYFQGVVLIPWSLLTLFAAVAFFTRPLGEPWPYTLTIAAMGVLGFPLAFGLLWKKRFALPLIYAMFGLSLLLAAIQVPTAIAHAADHGYRGSALPEAEMLLVWLFSLVYYRRRRTQFH